MNPFALQLQQDTGKGTGGERKKVRVSWFGEIKNDEIKKFQGTGSNFGFHEWPAMLNHARLGNERNKAVTAHFRH